MESFIVRLQEPVDGVAESAVRGVVRHVATGDEIAFVDSPQLVAFLTAHVTARSTNGDVRPIGRSAPPDRKESL